MQISIVPNNIREIQAESLLLREGVSKSQYLHGKNLPCIEVYHRLREVLRRYHASTTTCRLLNYKQDTFIS